MKQFVRLVSTAELMRRSRQGGAGGLMSQDARNYLRSRCLSYREGAGGWAGCREAKLIA